MANNRKFDKNRSVSVSWEYIPLMYSGIKHPGNKDKELVIMEIFGKHVSAAWRNHKPCRLVLHITDCK